MDMILGIRLIRRFLNNVPSIGSIFIKTSVTLTTVLNLFMKGHRIEHSKEMSFLREGLIKTIFKLYANNSFELKSLIH